MVITPPSPPFIHRVFDFACVDPNLPLIAGTQKAGDPNPGKPYDGTYRSCYLPDCPEGQEVLKLLRIAFDRRLTFRIGTSVTTGAEDTTIFNGIHHKTSLTGGVEKWGYPDPTYFERVKEELEDKGVTL
jgi:deltex